MLRYTARRLLVAIPVLFGILAMAFVMTRLLPGDPLLMTMSIEEFSASDEYLEQRREALGLDKPLPVQYVAWVGEVFQGNLGTSFHRRVPVTELIMQRIGPTVKLTGTGVLIALAIGVPIGVFAALKQNTRFDYTSATGSMIAISIPNFFLGLMAIFVFALRLKWFPTGGLRTLGGEPSLVDSLRHLAMPAAVLSAVLIGPYVRYTRQSMLDVLRQDYINTATAKGVPRPAILAFHGLRNALIPLTTVVAIQIPGLLAGTVIIETIFSWPGMGQLVLEGITRRDYPIIIGVVLVSAILVMLFNFLADILAAVLDPRIRL
ncbi:MAG: ABC transporter permease [Acidimicrobiia bacterium]